MPQDNDEKLAGQEGIDYAEYLLDSTRAVEISRLGKPGDVAELVAFLATEKLDGFMEPSSMSMAVKTRCVTTNCCYAYYGS